MRELIRRHPVVGYECLALAERRVEACVAKRPAAIEGGERDVALDGGELERQRCRWLRQACERFRFKPFDVDLDEGGAAMFGNQRIERGRIDADRLGPALLAPAVSVLCRADEIR